MFKLRLLKRGFCFERTTVRRITIITGHYGSGKTEFAVNLVLQLAAAGNEGSTKLAVADLDLVNPYFRSRERRGILEAAGVSVYGSTYKEEITAEIPALGASVRAPLEDKDCRLIVDAGGNDAGALVLRQFGKYFDSDCADVFLVVNGSRPDTRTAEGALGQLAAIQYAAGLKVTGLVGNTHLLRETTAADIRRGYALTRELSGLTSIPLIYTCYPGELISARDLEGIPGLYPLKLYMRPTWLDK
jgi:hypothetical protein